MEYVTVNDIYDEPIDYSLHYTYDPNGNLSGKTKTNASEEVLESSTYTFNNGGRMTQSTKDGVVTTYTYEDDGLRMSKTTSGFTTSFILDGADVVAEIKGSEITVYSRGLGLFAQTKGTTTKTYFSNDHGDVTGLFSSATSGEEALYDGFGITVFNDSEDNPFGYCGEYYDEETGLIYLRARYYDPEIGRFISEAPAMDGANWYVYCSNNPVMFVDSSGLSITLTGITDENDERFIALQNLTDDKLSVDLKTGIVSYTASDNIKREVSTNLIRDVIDNAMDCEITFYSDLNGGTGYTYDSKGNVIETHVYFNPKYSPSQWSYVEGEGYGERTKPAFMVMGHELVHVIRRMTDVERDTSVSGYYLGGPQPKKTLLRKGSPEELETTGIDYVKVINGDWANATRIEASKHYYSENALRLEYDRVHQNDPGYVKMGRRAV